MVWSTTWCIPAMHHTSSASDDSMYCDVAAGDPGDLLPGRLLERLARLRLGLDLRHGPKPTPIGLPSNYYAPPMSHLDTVRANARLLLGRRSRTGQLDRCTDDVVYEAPYYAIERHGKAELAAMLAAVQERFDSVSYVVVDDFPTVDPDLVIVEVRGDNRVPRRRAALPESLHHVPVLPRRPGPPLARVLNPDVYRTAVSTMSGSSTGSSVLDLTTGIAGPMTGMLLADHGARVTKVEPRAVRPTRAFSGGAGWHRGQAQRRARSARRRRPRPAPRSLAVQADVFIESYAPGTTASLGIDFDALRRVEPASRVLLDHPRTATREGTRPSGYEALRRGTGRRWKSSQRSRGTFARLADVAPAFPDLVVPDDLLGRRAVRARSSPACRR